LTRPRKNQWKQDLSEMSLSQLDELMQEAEQRRAMAARETELGRLRKELISRIVSSGYTFEEIFSGMGRFPQPLIQKLDAEDERFWSAGG
jgi:hypothetical protein